MRLIDADALVGNVADLYTEGEEATETDKVINNVIDIINNAPTVDFLINMKDLTAEQKQHFFNVWRNASFKITNERPQGEWIYLNEDEPMTVECPFCHERKCCISNYCDNCGADMQKGGAE